ncbi:MAG: hypothetical protein WAO83_02875 [Fuerstiella sp.]
MQTVNCHGWWEQSGLGRQPMHDLQLSFKEGEIQGSGYDIIGQFVLHGFVRADNVTLVKKYIGQHQVDYPGAYDGEGTFQGFWKMSEFGGRWLVKIQSTTFGKNDIVDIA